jgi:hypothetical protein
MRVLRYPVALVVVLAMVALTAQVLAWPLEKAVYLAPNVGGLPPVSAPVGEDRFSSLQESRHPRRVLAYWVPGIGLLVLLTVLGVKLPSEGG